MAAQLLVPLQLARPAESNPNTHARKVDQPIIWRSGSDGAATRGVRLFLLVEAYAYGRAQGLTYLSPSVTLTRRFSQAGNMPRRCWLRTMLTGCSMCDTTVRSSSRDLVDDERGERTGHSTHTETDDARVSSCGTVGAARGAVDTVFPGIPTCEDGKEDEKTKKQRTGMSKAGRSSARRPCGLCL